MSAHENQPPRAAAALRYDPESGPESAPRLVAKGRGELAERLLDIARENGVPVRHDPDLMQMLSAVRLGEEIPEDVYDAVAQLIGFLYRLNEDVGRAQP